MRTAYKCRAYRDPVQASMLNRTFGCVRVAWNQTLAWRRQRYHNEGTFRAMLEYKAARYGRRVIVIDRWYPSSKRCSACGHLLAELSLGTRAWQCPSCGTRHDRDHNAAKNILAAGLAVAEDNNLGHACGAGIRHSGSSRVQSAVKQEPWGVSLGIPSFKAGNSQGGSWSS